MSKLSFDFYNNNHTQRIKIKPAVGNIHTLSIITIDDVGDVSVLANTTVYATVDNLFLVAEEIKIGDEYVVVYQLKEDDFISGFYLGADITLVPTADVAIHEGCIIPAEDLSGSGSVGFEVVRIAELSKVDTRVITVNASSGSNILAGKRVAIDNNTKIAESTTGKYILGANYTATGTQATLNVYRAPCVIKVL